MDYSAYLDYVAASIDRVLTEMEKDELLDVTISEGLRMELRDLCAQFLLVDTHLGIQCIDLPTPSIRDAVLAKLLPADLLLRLAITRKELSSLDRQKMAAVANAKFHIAHDCRENYRSVAAEMKEVCSDFPVVVSGPLFSSILQELALAWRKRFRN